MHRFVLLLMVEFAELHQLHKIETGSDFPRLEWKARPSCFCLFCINLCAIIELPKLHSCNDPVPVLEKFPNIGKSGLVSISSGSVT